MSGSAAAHGHESGEHLVAMANDIANYFRPQARDEAIAGIAGHIKRFWTPRMQQKLKVYLATADGDTGLDELPRAAFATLTVPEARKP